MKFVLPILVLILSVFVLTPLKANKLAAPSWALSGTVQRVHEDAKLQSFLIDVTIDQRHVSGLFDLTDSKGQILNNWCSNPVEVVKVGRNNIHRTSVLTPNPVYGIDSYCYAKGYIFHNSEEDVYTAKQLSFAYRDPVSNLKRVDYVSGTVIPRTKDGGTTLYDVALAMEDETGASHMR